MKSELRGTATSGTLVHAEILRYQPRLFGFLENLLPGTSSLVVAYIAGCVIGGEVAMWLGWAHGNFLLLFHMGQHYAVPSVHNNSWLPPLPAGSVMGRHRFTSLLGAALENLGPCEHCLHRRKLLTTTLEPGIPPAWSSDAGALFGRENVFPYFPSFQSKGRVSYLAAPALTPVS